MPVTIQSLNSLTSLSSLPPDLLHEDLNAHSSTISSSPTTFYHQPTIPLHVSTTASPSQAWLSQPQSGQLAPAPLPLSLSPQELSNNNNNPQDFVLFPQPARRSFEASPNPQNTPSRVRSQAPGGSFRRHSAHITSASSALQNQRVAAIIHGTGHSISSPAFQTRYSPIAQAQGNFYAASAPSSGHLQAPPSRPRPEVPLFSQSTGSIPQKHHFQPTIMTQDMDLFDDYQFELDSGPAMTSFPDIYGHSTDMSATHDMSMSRSQSSSTNTNLGTVSPQDLLVRDPSMSAPNSTAFTNLTSPSMYNESPVYDDYDTSPMYPSQGLSAVEGQNDWFSLFPDANATGDAPNTSFEQSPLAEDEEIEVGEQLRDSRRRSATSPGSNKASAAAGVRKRSQPLPPIVVEDPSDTVAIKRARNTLAARKSRQKKMERFDELEAEIAKLKEERDHWKEKALARSGAQ